MDLPDCDPIVFNTGTVVFVSNTIRSTRMEEWVRKVRQDSGQPVDWSVCAGAAVVKALRDLHKVRKALINNKEMHDQFYKEALDELRDSFYNEERAKDMAWGIWKYNATKHGLNPYMCVVCRGVCQPQNHALIVQRQNDRL